MAAAEPARRRFWTRTDVEDAKVAGRRIELGPRDVLTDEAATRARDLGVEVVHLPLAPGAGTVGATPSGRTGTPGTDEDALRAAIRAAVAAELGPDTPGLEAAIDRVLARRRA